MKRPNELEFKAMRSAYGHQLMDKVLSEMSVDGEHYENPVFQIVSAGIFDKEIWVHDVPGTKEDAARTGIRIATCIAFLRTN